MACALVAGASLSGVATLMLLIISTSTGYWIKKKETANEGLWIYCTALYITRAFMLLSVISCFAGVVLGFTACKEVQSRLVQIGGIALLLSGFLALLALAIYTGKTLSHKQSKCSDCEFAWSHFLGWIGTISALAAGVLQLCANKQSD